LKHLGGQNWTKVFEPGVSDTGFRKMIEYDGKLFAGTLNPEEGSIICSSDDGLSWQPLEGWNSARSSDKGFRQSGHVC
jgi:hypothetical protein